MPSSKRSDWLKSLSKDALHQALQTRSGLHDHQVPPFFDWRTWLLLGGRGAGKTFAGATWLTQLARTENLTLALVGPTLHDVREVMVEGPSGLKALAEKDFRPHWEAGRRRLVWPTGTCAYAFSAEDPDSLRGPQFHHAWADEFCAWKKPEAVLDMLRLALRLGRDPRLLVTTTPRPLPALKRLLAEETTRSARAPTEANAAHLSERFLTHLRTLYAGTRLEAQELDGLVVETEGALFGAEDLARARGARPARLDKTVVAVDPPASAGGERGRRARAATPAASSWRGAGTGGPMCWPTGRCGACRPTAGPGA
ncbi:MAG: terminase family protein [Pseudomonadota bacterium]